MCNPTQTPTTPGCLSVRTPRTALPHNDAYTAYVERGRAERLTPEKIDARNPLATDQPEGHQGTADDGGRASLTLPMSEGDVVLAETTAN